MANLRSKCDRAVIAFISDAAKGVNAAVNLYPCFYSGERDQSNGLIDVVTSQGLEDPPFSGNHWMDVKIRIQSTAINQPSESDKLAARAFIGEMADAVFDVLHQTDNNSDYQYTARAISAVGNGLTADRSGGTDQNEIQRAKDDADMAAFSCLDIRGVHYLGAPDEGEKSLSFVEVMKFQMYAAASGGLN